MKRVLIALGIGSMFLAACQEKPVVHRSSIAEQFASMNKNGWAVSDGSAPKRAAPGEDPNVRVIREADFTGFHFNTNFQVDDPRIREQLRQQNGPGQPAPAGPGYQVQSGGGFWGAAPVAPGSH